MRDPQSTASEAATDLGRLCQDMTARSPLPTFATEGETHIIAYANPAFCRLCGKRNETLRGWPVAEALPQCREDGSLSLLDRVYRTGEAQSIADLQHLDPARGPACWSYAVWAVPGSQGALRGVLVQVVDTTEQAIARHRESQMSDELREINQKLVISGVREQEMAEQSRQAAVLEERNRIAREIHDTLAQAFTGILRQLDLARRLAGQRPEEAWSIIEQIDELAREGLAQARLSVLDLHPQALEFGDLAEALSRAAEQMTAGTPVHLDLRIVGAPRSLPPNIGLNLLRIGQEALTNVLRHAQARHVWIEIAFEDSLVRLSVRDDGQGFDPRLQADADGFGLIAMRQRAEAIGAEWTIVSGPHRGTDVSVTLSVAMP